MEKHCKQCGNFRVRIGSFCSENCKIIYFDRKKLRA